MGLQCCSCRGARVLMCGVMNTDVWCVMCVMCDNIVACLV